MSEKLSNNTESNAVQSSPWDALGDVKPSSVTKAETDGQLVEATEDNHIEISFDNINSKLEGSALQLPPDEYAEFDTKELFDQAFEQNNRVIKLPEELESSFIEASDDNHIEFPDRYSSVIDHNGNLVVHSKKED